jgi:hypothetical protein
MLFIIRRLHLGTVCIHIHQLMPEEWVSPEDRINFRRTDQTLMAIFKDGRVVKSRVLGLSGAELTRMDTPAAFDCGQA